jgi:hypothetical protein
MVGVVHREHLIDERGDIGPRSWTGRRGDWAGSGRAGDFGNGEVADGLERSERCQIGRGGVRAGVLKVEKFRDDGCGGDALGLGDENGVQARGDDGVVVQSAATHEGGSEVNALELLRLNEITAFAQEANAAANVRHVSPVGLQGWKLERQLNWQRRGDPSLQTMFNKFSARGSTVSMKPTIP